MSDATMPSAAAPTRADFPRLMAIATRWMDNDVYGHVNNVTYYSYFDTAVNAHLVAEAGLDPATSQEIGLVVETQCSFRREISFPEILDVGIRVEKIGNSSVVYAIGIFKQGSDAPAAIGRFVHVYVDRDSRKTVRVPDRVRQALAALITP
jgi:acyl-CoA thioester hydrolase